MLVLRHKRQKLFFWKLQVIADVGDNYIFKPGSRFQRDHPFGKKI